MSTMDEQQKTKRLIITGNNMLIEWLWKNSSKLEQVKKILDSKKSKDQIISKLQKLLSEPES